MRYGTKKEAGDGCGLGGLWCEKRGMRRKGENKGCRNRRREGKGRENRRWVWKKGCGVKVIFNTVLIKTELRLN